MNTLPTWPAGLGEDDLLLTAAVVAFKLTLLLAVAWCAHGMLLRVNPRWRVLLWRSAGLGIALVLALTASPPLVSWSVLPAAIGEQEAATRRGARSSENTARLRVATAQPIADDRASHLEALQDRQRSRWPLGDDGEIAFERPAQPLGSAAPSVEPASAVTADAFLKSREEEAEPFTTRSALTAYPRLMGWMAGIWLAGALGLGGRMLCGLRRLRAIVRRALPVPPWVEEEAAAVIDQLGCPREFDVRQSGDVATPCLVGIRRPVVLLPEPQCDIARREELPAIFAHEAAHLTGRDLTWNAALHGLSLLVWWHPLTWRIRAAHAAACDAVADAIAAHHVGDVTAYGRTLARLAVRLHAPPPASALAMARTSDIRRRIEALQRSLFPHPLPRRRKATAITLGTLTLTLLGSVTLTPAQGDPQPDVSTRSNPSVESPTSSNENRSNPTLLATQNDPPKEQVAEQQESENDRPKAGVDLYGDPLPPGAVSRLGTVRYRYPVGENRIEFLHGGTTLAVGGFEGTVSLMDATTGRLLRGLDIGDDELVDFRISVDGKSIVTLSRRAYPRFHDMRLLVWNAETGAEIRPIEWTDSDSRSIHLALSPDTKLAAVGTNDGEVRIWDLPWGEERLRRQMTPDEDRILGLEFSPSGNVLAVATREGVDLWAIHADNEPQKLVGWRPGSPRMMRFSPDGSILAIACNDSHPAHFYRVETRKLIRQLRPARNRDFTTSLCFAEGGRQLIVPLGNSRMIEVFDVGTGELVRKLNARGRGTRSLTLSSDGRLLAGVSGAAIVVWDLATGERISDRFVGHESAPWDVVFTPDDQHVVTASSDATIRIWDAKTGRHLRVLAHEGMVTGLAVSPDGRCLASSASDYTVRLWDFANGEERFELPGHFGVVGSNINEVAFSADGEQFYSFGADLNLRTYSTRTGRLVAEHAIRPSGIPIEKTEQGWLRLAGRDLFSSGGDIFAGLVAGILRQAAWNSDATLVMLHTSLDDDGSVHLFDVQTGREVGKVKLPEHVLSVGLPPRGDLMATVEEVIDQNAEAEQRSRQILRLRDLATKEVAGEVRLDGRFGYIVAFSPDGKLIAASQRAQNGSPAADKWADVWEVDTLERVARLAKGSPAVRGIGFSHDGRLLATSHEDSTVSVWDLQAFMGGK